MFKKKSDVDNIDDGDLLDNPKIADRGTKSSIKDCQADKSKLFKLIGLLSLSIIGLVFGIFFKMSLTNYYMVSDKGRLSEMKKVANKDVEISEAGLMSFIEDTVMLTFGLSYKDYNTQLNHASIRYEPEAFKQLVEEMKRSNFINLLVKYHRINTIIPTATVYDIKQVKPDVFDIYRTYMFESVGDSGVERHEVLYVVRIALVEKTKRYFYGLQVLNIHQVDLTKYIKEHGVKADVKR
jgi:hypothetical protein